MARPKDTDQSGQEDTKYALDADDLIAAALESFDRIVDGVPDSKGTDGPGGLDLDLDAGEGEHEDSFLEVVGLQDRLEARAERRLDAPAELDLDFDDDDPNPSSDAPAAPRLAGGTELAAEHELLQGDHEELRSQLVTLQGKYTAIKAEFKDVRRGQKDRKDGVRVLEMKLQRKEETLGVLKMERDDLSGTLKMWEKMVAEMRTAARKQEEDQERIRRRHKKEQDDTKLLANEKLFKKLIPALDNLELALNHSEVDGQHTAEQVIEGIRMTATHLFKTVEQAGLDRMQSEPGAPFDPSIHDAVERVQDPNQPADTIAVCLSPGYSLRGRLIRPARVSVYYGGPSAPVPPPDHGDDDGGES